MYFCHFVYLRVLKDNIVSLFIGASTTQTLTTLVFRYSSTTKGGLQLPSQDPGESKMRLFSYGYDQNPKSAMTTCSAQSDKTCGSILGFDSDDSWNCSGSCRTDRSFRLGVHVGIRRLNSYLERLWEDCCLGQLDFTLILVQKRSSQILLAGLTMKVSMTHGSMTGNHTARSTTNCSRFIGRCKISARRGSSATA